jgi:hypothetical protein
MVLDFARETVTLTVNANRDSSANKEMETLLSMDASEKDIGLGITVSNQLMLRLPNLLRLKPPLPLPPKLKQEPLPLPPKLKQEVLP